MKKIVKYLAVAMLVIAMPLFLAGQKCEVSKDFEMKLKNYTEQKTAPADSAKKKTDGKKEERLALATVNAPKSMEDYVSLITSGLFSKEMVYKSKFTKTALEFCGKNTLLKVALVNDTSAVVKLSFSKKLDSYTPAQIFVLNYFVLSASLFPLNITPKEMESARKKIESKKCTMYSSLSEDLKKRAALSTAK